MNLAKVASQKTKNNNQLKSELLQQQNNELFATKHQTKGEGARFGKHFSGTIKDTIRSGSNNSGSWRSIVACVNRGGQRNSFGNASCISFESTNNKCTKKKRKSKKWLNSTVFRCCLPCRGGSGSAAPATSPPHSPVLQTNSNSITTVSTIRRNRSGKSALELTTEGNESLIAAVKKHSLAETIVTSANTPISLKTLINDEEEDLQEHISAADIAAAQLASGILARKAEPETLSDTSISPTTAVLQLNANSASASSLLSNTTSVLSTTAGYSQVTSVSNKTTTTQISPTTPPNKNRNFICQSAKGQQHSSVSNTINAKVATTPSPLSPLLALTTVASPSSGVTSSVTFANNTATATTSSSAVSSTPSRCCCPPPQTSPLPHIEEEEESEQLLQRQHSAINNGGTATVPTLTKQENQQQQSLSDQLSPFTANPSGSSDSCTSLSTTAVTTNITSSITGGGCTPLELTTTSTPSPRIKHKFRKQHKSAWSRIILTPNSSIIPIGAGCGAANSSETLPSSSNNSSCAIAASAALAAPQTRLTSSSASALAIQQSSSSQLLPSNKMQAEQGSIGDLQKYHSRYLKNRRHTLANVR